ncbi:hypothetical protein L6452_06037 [Arctium lappa]|uniref:Uncharacterized protein n=1 Tax=Arctium lappa TaxID=4217 RepID=A0ACB9EHS4_ARCLA|nr:hypothetical protein L6452_06037 [Arctium lappa]
MSRPQIKNSSFLCDFDKEGEKNKEEETIAERPAISEREKPQQQPSLARGRADEDEDDAIFISQPPPIFLVDPLIEPVHTTNSVEVDEEDDDCPEIPDQEGDGKDDADNDDDNDNDTDTYDFVFQRIPHPSKGILIKDPSAQGKSTSQHFHQGKGKSPAAEGNHQIMR